MSRGCSFSWVAVMIVMVLTVAGNGYAKDEKVETYRFTPGKVLEIDLEGGGSVEIVGWDRDEAEVTYYDTILDVEDHKVRIKERKGGLVITTEMNRGRNVSTNMTFEIRVPRKIRLEFESIGGGLDLEDLEGEFEGVTAGGVLRLVNVDGEVDMTSGGGGIFVSDCNLDGDLTTGGGEVLLENVVGNLEAHSGGGDVQYKNVRGSDGRLRVPGGLSTNGITEDTVVITTAGGGIHVKRAPEGARVRTGGGEVWIDNAARFVEAWTGGGDMWIRANNAWVGAWTGAGDIEVEVEEGLGDSEKGIEIFTGTGDIIITLPADASMEMDLEIGYTRNSSQRYAIESDWHIEIERTKEWDYDNGSPRKYIRGKARIGDGRHLIRIRTMNGHITIEKKD